MIEPDIVDVELGRMELYSRASFGKIFEIPEVDSSLLCKMYASHPRPAEYLDRVIDIRAGAERQTKEQIDEQFSWPMSRVQAAGGVTVGVVIPKAPERFWATLHTGPSRVRDLNYLLYERRATRAGVDPPSTADKLRVLRAFARSLNLILSLGLIHEDLSPTNVLWAVEPAPAVYLLDCDSIRPFEAADLGPLILSPEWSDPRVIDKAISRPDMHSVSYVFALHVVRIFCGPSWRPPLAAAAISDESAVPIKLMHLTRRSLDVAHVRPSMMEWISALDEAAENAGQEPSDSVGIRGSEVDQYLGARSMSYTMQERLVLLAGALLGTFFALFLLWLIVVR